MSEKKYYHSGDFKNQQNLGRLSAENEYPDIPEHLKLKEEVENDDEDELILE